MSGYDTDDIDFTILNFEGGSGDRVRLMLQLDWEGYPFMDSLGKAVIRRKNPISESKNVEGYAIRCEPGMAEEVDVVAAAEQETGFSLSCRQYRSVLMVIFAILFLLIAKSVSGY